MALRARVGVWAARATARKAPRETPRRAMRVGSTVGWAAMWVRLSAMVSSQRGTWWPSRMVWGSARVVPVRSK